MNPCNNIKLMHDHFMMFIGAVHNEEILYFANAVIYDNSNGT